jgi:hypothetical protein
MAKAKAKGPMPIEERAKRFLAAFAKHGGKSPAKAFRKLGEVEQCSIVSTLLGEALTPDRNGHYYCTCPGKGMHTGKNARRDCRFTPGDNGHDPRTAAPSLHCLHQSCGSVVEEFNRRIRSECGKASVERITDHGCILNNAAAALRIGFDMDEKKATKVLSVWNQTRTPPETDKRIAAAIAAASAARDKKPDEIGYLLRKTASKGNPSLTHPPTAGPSFESACDLGSTDSVETNADNVPARIFIGERGRLAKQVRDLIEIHAEEYGQPTAVLLGPDQPDISGTLCQLPIQRMETPGVSLHYGENVDG